MIYLIFTAILLLISTQVVGVLYIKRWYEGQKSALINAAHAYFESPGDGKPSEFAGFIDLAAQTFATRIMQSARLQLANMTSISSRQNAKLEEQGIADAIPGVIGMVPGIGRMIRKNPILGLAAEYLASKMPNAGVPPPVTVASGNGKNNPFEI